MGVAGKKGLLLTSEQYVSAAVVANFLSDRGLQPDDVVVITQSGNLPMGVIGLQDGLVDVALSISPVSGYHNAKLLGEIRRVLRAGGALTVEEPVTSRPLSATETKAAGMASGQVLKQEEVEKGLLFAGFAEAATAVALTSGADARFGSLAAPAGPLATVAVSSKKPSWEVGAKSSLKLRKRPKAEKPAFDADAVSKAWGSAAAGGDDAMIDEDALLTADDLAAPAAEAKGDCSTSRKACKNCVCGRAEMEAGDTKNGTPVNLNNPYLTAEQLENPQSACGSCGLGDAFRCATCPYRGMPAFAPGEKITLGSSLLTADMDI